METLLLISLIMLWVVVLIILVLTLRVIRWVKALHDAQAVQQEHRVRPDLVVGAPAPEFKARTLAGQPVRLDDYAGRAVAFLFVSPACGHCRLEMPVLNKLGSLAQKNADVEFVLASSFGPVETQLWLDRMRAEDGVDVTLPMLVAPYGKSDFLEDYNPSGLWPGFCLLDDQGIVQAQGSIPSVEWNKLRRTWEGTVKLSPWLFNQYR